jgi:hypothetical protein
VSIKGSRRHLRLSAYVFNTAAAPSELVGLFRGYYGPTMNAPDAAEKNGRSDELRQELEALFNGQKTGERPARISIPATFLRVTATV